MSPQAKYFSLGGCGVSAITMLPTDRLMALMRCSWYTLGRDCTVPPCKAAKSCDQ